MTSRLHRWLLASLTTLFGAATAVELPPAFAQQPGRAEAPRPYGAPSVEPDVRLRRPAVVSSIAPSTSLPDPADALRPGVRAAETILSPAPGHSLDVSRERLFNELAEEFDTFDRLGNLVKRVAQLVQPSVMHIEAHKTETTAGHRASYDEAGSGVVIDVGGQLWVLTNRHVVAGSKPQEILLRTHDGRELSPSRVFSDASTDIAVLELSLTDLPAARLGNSQLVEVGDFVIAIGSPFGLSHSVTFGVVSAKGRRDLSLGEQKIDLQDFFQTDAAINPGNSGGPLLNLRGEVIALNTAIASSSGGSEGIGFAIPINMGVQVAEQLVRFGRLRRGYLGVTLEPDFSPADMVAAGYQPSGGALVKNVRPDSPAALARLQRGDIIVEFDGRPVENDDHLVARVGLTALGQAIPMIIYRDGQRYQTDVVLVDMTADATTP